MQRRFLAMLRAPAWLLVFAVFLSFAPQKLFSQTVAVSSTLTDGSGGAVGGKLSLHFVLFNCGPNVPITSAGSAIVKRSFDIVANSSGLAAGTVVPNDLIKCGNVANTTQWTVSAMSAENAPITQAQNYFICSSVATGVTCAQSAPGATFNIATAQPSNATPPAPAFLPVLNNPTQSQTITQPGGTNLNIDGSINFGGTVNFCSSTVLCGGNGGTAIGTAGEIDVTNGIISFANPATAPGPFTTNGPLTVNGQFSLIGFTPDSFCSSPNSVLDWFCDLQLPTGTSVPVWNPTGTVNQQFLLGKVQTSVPLNGAIFAYSSEINQFDIPANFSVSPTGAVSENGTTTTTLAASVSVTAPAIVFNGPGAGHDDYTQGIVNAPVGSSVQITAPPNVQSLGYNLVLVGTPANGNVSEFYGTGAAGTVAVSAGALTGAVVISQAGVYAGVPACSVPPPTTGTAATCSVSALSATGGISSGNVSFPNPGSGYTGGPITITFYDRVDMLYGLGTGIQLASNFTTAANTSLQTFLSLPIPATGKYTLSIHCAGTYSQATANVAVAFGVQLATATPTRADFNGQMSTTKTAASVDSLINLTSTTATPIMSYTPGVFGNIGTQAALLRWVIDGKIQNPAATANTANFMVSTANAADLVTIYPDSQCQVTQ